MEMVRILKEWVAGRTSIAWFHIADIEPVTILGVSLNFVLLIYRDVN
jgi:hypothetical protein